MTRTTGTDAVRGRRWTALALALATALALLAQAPTAAATADDGRSLLLEEPDHEVDDAWEPDPDETYDPTDVAARAEAEEVSEAEAERRFRREDAAVLVQREARERWPTTYAGTWIDVEDTFDIVVAFTDDPQPKVRELRRHVTDSERLRGVRAVRSLAELYADQDRIVQDRDRLLEGRRPEGVPDAVADTNGRFNVAVHQPDNEITVRVDGATPARAAAFQDHYGPHLRLGEGAGAPHCSIQDCRPRMIGGLALNGSQCTSGFGTIRSGQPQMLSAGHCGGSSRSHGGTFYGSVAQSIVQGRTDAQRISQGTWGWDHTNRIGVVGEPLRAITSFFGVNDYVVGMQVGTTGLATGTRRGLITHTNMSVHWVPGTNHFVETDYGTSGGDSGGPVFRNNAALGIHSGGSSTWSAFGRIHYAIFDLGVSLMTSDFNDAPQARFTSSCSALMQCQFNGTASRDIDGFIASYSWSFGDGTTGTGSSPNKQYLLPGTYTVRLTVTDNGGKSASTTRTIQVGVL